MTDNNMIGGKYRLQKLLGKGGTAEVFLAWDVRLHKNWAVKKLKKEGTGQKLALGESELLGRLDHPALPRIVDRIEEGGCLYLVMDYVEGESMDQVLARKGPQNGMQVWQWARELAQVLNYLHTRHPAVIYRDLKPANIILQKNGRLKLIDLGIAAVCGKKPVPWATREYAAPEQLKGVQDCRSDLYCLGVTLYKTATGKLPGRMSGRLSRVRRKKRISGLSRRFSKILWKCMEDRMEKRFRSCRELISALEKCPESRQKNENASKTYRKHFLSAAAILLLCGIGIVNSRQEFREKEAAYADWIRKAERSVLAGDQSEALQQAILLCPGKMEGYRLLIEHFKRDEKFQIEEEKLLLTLLESGGEELKQQKGYADLLFQIGELYWYYYAYGTEEKSGESELSDNELTRMKSAIPWFEETAVLEPETDQGRLAGLYKETGIFYRDLTFHIREGTEPGEYRKLWNNLHGLANELEKKDCLPETVRLELCRMCIRAAASYRSGFLAEGITAEELSGFRNSIAAEAERIRPSSVRGETLQKEIRKEMYDGG